MKNNRIKYNEILVIIVSFNGFPKIKQTIDALYNKVGHILIVDNASEAVSQDFLDSIERKEGVSISRLIENKGIGYALNVGINQAKSMNYNWLLTMDQDSIIDPTMIDEYCKCLNYNTELECLTPNIVVHGKKDEITSDKYVKYAITSGNLVKTSLFDEIGMYNEDLFIDCIDFDFSLRVRQAGYGIYRVNSALMQHELGDEFNLPPILAKFYTLHSPLRRYYMYRNSLYIINKYFFTFPLFVIKLTISNILLLLLIPFNDSRPFTSLLYVFRGVKDYLSGVRGIYREINK